jgi:hypothetical protein
MALFELLGGGKKDAGWDGSAISKARLALLPNVTHYNMNTSPALASTVDAVSRRAYSSGQLARKLMR